MKMAALVILIPPMIVLGGTALAVSLEAGRSTVSNPGPHGFSQILYALSSAGNNNAAPSLGSGSITCSTTRCSGSRCSCLASG